jgi:hypothetical protein
MSKQHFYKDKYAVIIENKSNLSVFQIRSIFPVERSLIHAPIGARENSTISSGGVS